MPTVAKGVCDRNLRRAKYFVESHDRVGAPTNPVRELPCAALVFAVGALDAYLGHVSAEVLVARGRQAVLTPGDQEVLETVVGEVKSLALEVAFVADHDQRLSALQRAVTNYFEERHSNHGWKAVMATVVRVGGEGAAFRQRVVAAGYADPHDVLDDYTALRHDIVHRGQSPQARRPKAQACLDYVGTLVGFIDDIAAGTTAALAAP